MNKKVVILNDTRSDNHHGCTRVMKNLTSSVMSRSGDIIYTHMLGECVESKILIDNLQNADIAIINGEGTIHGDKDYAYNLLKIVTKHCQGKSYLINSTYLNNGKRFIDLLRCFDGIYVRDQASQDELNTCNIKSTIIPDLSFLSDSVTESDENNGYYLVGCSVDRKVTAQLYLNFKNKNKFLPISIFENRGLFEKAKLVRGSVSKYDIFDLIKCWKYFSARLWFEEEQVRDDEELSKKLSNSLGIVTGRYHEVCIALNNHIPILAVESNTRKISSLLENIGLEKRMINTSDNVCEIPPYNESEMKLLTDFLLTTKTDIKNMFDEIFK